MTNRLKFRVLLFSLVMLVAVSVFDSFTKSEYSASGSERQLAVYLTDHPADFDKVLEQINLVEVTLDISNHQDDDNYGLILM
jgi:hypothetical protein